MKSDADLLREYAVDGSEAAFTELVRRHIDLVYAAAVRQLGDDGHLAGDVTQTVFTALARKAARLSRHTSLAGWLYTSVRFAAGEARRTERRRRQREQKAHEMNELLSPVPPDPTWEQLRPVLDEAMHDLGERDRLAVLLRYFEDKSFGEVGAALSLGENAARMRVERALEKLRALLVRRGVVLSLSAAGVGSLLATQAVAAAPPALAASVAGAALSGAAGAGAGLITTFMEALLMTTKTKLAIAVVVGAAAVTVPVVVVQHQRAVAQEGSEVSGGNTFTPAAKVERIDVVIAQHVMLLNNRIVTWDDVEWAVAQHPDPASVKLGVWHTWTAIRRAAQRQDHRATIMALGRKYGIDQGTVGSLSSRASARYDAIREASDLVPDESWRVSGAIETPQGRPVAGAEVVLCAGTNEVFDVYVKSERVRERLNEIVTDTDEDGRFAVFPPADTAYLLLVLHPEGFALAGDGEFSPARPIILQPWTELQVTLQHEPKYEQYVSVTFRPPASSGRPQLSLRYQDEQPASRFLVPAPGTATVGRCIRVPEDQMSVCPSGQEIAIVPGEAQSVALGPVTEADLEALERHAEIRRRIREERSK